MANPCVTGIFRYHDPGGERYPVRDHPFCLQRHVAYPAWRGFELWGGLAFRPARGGGVAVVHGHGRAGRVPYAYIISYYYARDPKP